MNESPIDEQFEYARNQPELEQSEERFTASAFEVLSCPQVETRPNEKAGVRPELSGRRKGKEIGGNEREAEADRQGPSAKRDPTLPTTH